MVFDFIPNQPLSNFLNRKFYFWAVLSILFLSNLLFPKKVTSVIEKRLYFGSHRRTVRARNTGKVILEGDKYETSYGGH